MIRIALALALALVLELEAGAQTFPVPGPGHVPWVAVGGGGPSYPVESGLGTFGVEKRCDDLGAACKCSEPLANSDTPGTSWNPSDTLAASTKECSDRRSWWWETDAPSKATTATSPDGLKALRLVGGGANWMSQPPSASDVRRVCVRYYKRVSDDYSAAGPFQRDGLGNPLPPVCPSERNKIAQFWWQNGNSQMQEDELNSGTTNCGVNGVDYDRFTINNSAVDTIYFSSPYRWSNCKSGWCRFEFCASGEVAAGNGIRLDGYIKLATGESESRSLSVPVPLGPQQTYNGGDLFHGQGTGPLGSEWIKFFMYAEWTTDAGQTIGAACEMEGGC